MTTRPVVDVARAVAPQDNPDPNRPMPKPAGRPSSPQSAEAITLPVPTKEINWADGATLTELEELADRVNPSLRRDLALIESSRGRAVQAAVWSNPRFDTNNPQVLNGRQTLLNAGVQMEVPVMGKKNLDKSAANEGTRQAEMTYAQNRLALHAAIRQQFYAVLVDQERIRVLTRLSDLARQIYDAAEGKEKAGEATRFDVLTFRVAYQRSQGALDSAIALLVGDQKQLEAIIGEPGIIRGPVRGKVTAPYPEFDEKGLIEYVTRKHTQIMIAESILRQDKVLLRRAEVEPYPNPYLGPAYQFGLVPGNDQFWFNIQFAIPVWDRNQGNIRAAKADLLSAHESINVSRLNLVNQAQNLLSQYKSALALVKRFEGGVITDVNEAVEFAQVGYKNRIIDRATLYQAQQAAAQANSDYLDALQNLWLNATQLSGLLQREQFLPTPVASEPDRPMLPPGARPLPLPALPEQK
jgi:cobalt-zinc-cadmium efflux system outer membrane protein